MKRADLKSKAEEFKDDPDGFINYIMSENGKDINSYREQVENANAKYSEYEEKIKLYQDTASKYKDYDELIKFKTDTLAQQEKSKKINYLKSKGIKHPDLVFDKFNFEKATYDDKANTYSGLDEQLTSFKTTYPDLFDDAKPNLPNVNKPRDDKGSIDHNDDYVEAYRKKNGYRPVSYIK